MDRYYKILGLEPGASPEEVRQAYRDLAKVWHPDRFSDKDSRLKEKAEAKTRELNEAYDEIVKSGFRVARDEPYGPEEADTQGDAWDEWEPGFHDSEGPAPHGREPSPFGWFLKALMVFSLVMVAVIIGAGLVGRKIDRFLGAVHSREEGSSAVNNAFKMLGELKKEILGEQGDGALKAQKGPRAGFIAIGMDKNDVRRLQGEPGKIEQQTFGELWWYNKSSIQFMGDRVMAFSNRGDLKVAARVEPGREAKPKKLYQYRDKEGRIYISDAPRSR